MRAAHFCSACGKVQPPAPVDYFSFFGLPPKLRLDTSALERDFYQLSRRLHPDVKAGADPQEQTWSLEKSSQLNDAYRTLRDPILRTQYLLRLQGVELEEQSKSATEKARATGETKKQVVPPSLLEEVFELNMQLEELRRNRKMGETDPALVEELQRRKRDLESSSEALSRELQGYWDEWDRLVDAPTASAGSPEAARKPVLDKMTDLLNRRNYSRNLVRDVNGALEEQEAS